MAPNRDTRVATVPAAASTYGTLVGSIYEQGEMDTGNWTAPGAQILLSADTGGATYGRGHQVHGGRAGKVGSCAQCNLNEDVA